MDHLLLQRPQKDSRSKDHIKALGRRLEWWKDGDFSSLYSEAEALQKRHKKDKEKSQPVPLHRRFANLVFQDRMQDALRLLDREEGSGGVHELTEEVVATLKELQFDPGPVVKGALLRQGKVPNPPQPVIFEVITAEAIKRAAEKTKGSHGPSGGDAELWKKQLLSFGPSSHALREAIAAATRRLCSTFIDQVCLEALLACRLLPLMKKGGRVRPIGIGEVLRRIIGKSIVHALRKDITESLGSWNLCGGQRAGCETVVHLMTDCFEDDANDDGMLLLDGLHAFQKLNRKTALHNIRHLCPPFSIVCINFYRAKIRLFLGNGHYLWSSEGTTQAATLP